MSLTEPTTPKARVNAIQESVFLATANSKSKVFSVKQKLRTPPRVRRDRRNRLDTAISTALLYVRVTPRWLK